MLNWVPALLEEVYGRVPYRRHELRTALERFAAWAEDEAALEGEAADLLTPRNIERFSQGGLDDYAPASRGNIRSRLLRISELVLDPHERRVRLRPIGPADPLQPYTKQEVAALHSWAASQSTERRRRCAITLLSLGLGAGLSAAEISESRIADFVAGTIHVRGARARCVPMLAAHAADLRMIVEDYPDPTGYLFRPDRSSSWPNLISNFVSRGRPSDLRPQSQRMRSTWITQHLSAGTNVRTLVRAAGVESLEAFTRYLRFVDEPHPTEARNQLVRANA